MEWETWDEGYVKKYADVWIYERSRTDYRGRVETASCMCIDREELMDGGKKEERVIDVYREEVMKGIDV